MVNIQVFSSIRGALLPAATVRNEAGGLAYARNPRSAYADGRNRVNASGCS